MGLRYSGRYRVQLYVEVRPGLDYFQNHRARTLRRMQLALRKQFIVLVQLGICDAPFEQIPKSPDLFVGWFDRIKRPDQGHANRVGIIVWRVQASHVPSTPLKDNAVATNQKVISDILVIGDRMFRLYLLQDPGAIILQGIKIIIVRLKID